MTLPDPAYDPGYYTDLPLKRAIAFVVDLFIISLATVLVVLSTLGIGLFAFVPLWATLAILYRGAMLLYWDGTIGMKLAALRLRGLDGGRPESIRVILHAVIATVTMLTVFGQLLSALIILLTPYRQGLADLFCATTMVHSDPLFDQT